ncbi:aminoglycoside phosphotransferase family protein [Plantactinospora sp. GCM10030261]|uniref:aminoglycoside phosphotransferase family protein n=1 Tax=Plantactinospora sp. GCM10030261 TaxID=3273420 RepID=UPI00360EA9B5
MSSEFARNVVAEWGEEGRRWLAELPELSAAVAEDWGLRLGGTFRLTFHWVVSAVSADGDPVVLKLGVPGQEHLAVEAAALRAFAGRGAVRLLATDLDRGALLLERASPGAMARELVPARDAEATEAVVAVLRRLHVPPPPDAPPPPDSPVPPLRGYRRFFVDHLRRWPGDGPVPRRLVVRALGLFDELCDSAPRTVVLHGDLHHDNVLRAEREPWLAIDPHGVVGDPGFDVGPLLYNPEPDDRDPALLDLVPARVEQLAEGLVMDRDRVVAWGFCAAVLSEVWTVSDGGPARTRAVDVASRLWPELR